MDKSSVTVFMTHSVWRSPALHERHQRAPAACVIALVPAAGCCREKSSVEW